MASPKYDFTQIYARFRPKIHAYLSRLAGPDDADDLCQEVFLRVEKGLHTFRGDASLATWVYRIASNSFHDRLRSSSYKQQNQEQPVETDDPGYQSTTSATREAEPETDQQIIRGEMNACIREYIDQLSPAYREVLLLSEDEGFKQREIADILQISLDNVKIRLHRARAAMKQSLQSACDFYLDERSEVACDRKQSGDQDN